MYRYTWVAILPDGRVEQRWNSDGSENIPPAYPKEFHLLPEPGAYDRGLRPFSLFLKEGQRLIFRKRRHIDSVGGGPLRENTESVVYVVGYEEDLDYAHFGTYAFLLPDGRVEWSSSFNHPTIFERNIDVDPPRFYEVPDYLDRAGPGEGS